MLPKLGVMGDSYLEYWVYAPDSTTRLIDPNKAQGAPTENKRRFSLMGKLDTATGMLALTGVEKDAFGGSAPITNSPILLGALKVGSKVRVNNRFILAMYFYPRYSNIAGDHSYDQYRNCRRQAQVSAAQGSQRSGLCQLPHDGRAHRNRRDQDQGDDHRGPQRQPVLAAVQRQLWPSRSSIVWARPGRRP